MSKAQVAVLFWVGIVIGTLLVACKRCESDMRTKIGTFESMDDGMRSSIRKLAEEIKRCPKAMSYRVIWESPMPEGGEQRLEQAILYSRYHKKLGWEHDIGSGISGRAYVVGDEDIHKVAEQGGSLEDFAEYDQDAR